MLGKRMERKKEIGNIMKEKCPCCKEKYPKGEEKRFMCTKCTLHEDSCNPTVKELKNRMAHILGNQCYICHGIYDDKKTFVIHHKFYNNKKYSDYPSQLAYHLDLIYEVEQNPEQFLLLHNKCHQALHRLKRWKPDNRKRLKQAEEMTHD